MIEDKLEAFRQEVDLIIDHGPLSNSEIYSLRAILAYLFGEFLFVDRSKGRAHLSMVWTTRQLDYLEGLFNLPSGLGVGAHHHSSPSSRSTDAIILDDSLLVIWSVGFLEDPFAVVLLTVLGHSGRRGDELCALFFLSSFSSSSSPLYPSLFDFDISFFDFQIDWTIMRVEPVHAAYTSSFQAFRTMIHLICMFLVTPTFSSRVRHQLGLPQTSCEITLPWTPIMELRTAYLDEGRSSTDEVASIRAERDCRGAGFENRGFRASTPDF
ncbi:hypothetical protein AMTR_s00020p00124950 [Amborella trichopoda]|uniref:Uncharacterized protein n=1 Tax=Amborella trichopoda TaxID=13333 RepID=W1PUW6_AMBTC|nr:hypothetical protein AMTR_s00020p00124950 [Amborella trichopoda]